MDLQGQVRDQKCSVTTIIGLSFLLITTFHSCILKRVKATFVSFMVWGLIPCMFMESCSRTRHPEYTIPDHSDSLCVTLLNWNVDFDDSIESSTDTLRTYHGLYRPKYKQMDMKELLNIDAEDTTGTYDGKYVHLSCLLKSKSNRNAYLEVKSGMPMSILYGMDTLRKREIQGLNIYPIRLHKGTDTLHVNMEMANSDYTIEASIYDSVSIARIYTEWQSCNIVYPIIPDKEQKITLTNAHRNVLNTPVDITFADVRGNELGKIALEKDSLQYGTGSMQPQVSYMCTMKMNGMAVRQPVLCGDPDKAYVRLCRMLELLPPNHPRRDEIKELLYRMNFLLKHPSREDDWWWQFKIPSVTYQLEHVFAHLEDTYGQFETEANVNFITYRSETDNSIQHYLLVLPNEFTHLGKMPLVVVVRPFCQNPHHFFASPQVARQWAINIVQGLANKYGFIVMMPEARMQLSEDLTEDAAREFLLAIKDVEGHYKVDTGRIYLHANCTGGYRALKLAEKNNNLFSAIALYAPVYDMGNSTIYNKYNAPSKNISSLKDVPMMIHYDPIDEHSPYSQFANLITDCNRIGVPLEVSAKRNSGRYYNVVIAGTEAFEFFNTQKDK